MLAISTSIHEYMHIISKMCIKYVFKYRYLNKHHNSGDGVGGGESKYIVNNHRRTYSF